MRTEGLCKEYDGAVAVSALDLCVPRGSFFGLLGPNGAGKTTTIGMLTGLLRPTAGRAIVAGREVWPDPTEVKRRVGVVPEDPGLFEQLTAQELLTYHGRLRGLDGDLVAERSSSLFDLLDLTEVANEVIAGFSRGMRKKVALAAALLHAPALLILDEPFEAVDPISTRAVRVALDRYVGTAGTVIFSSHVMETVERLATHVGVMHRGHLLAQGPLDAVRGRHPSLEEAFLDLVGAPHPEHRGLEWLEPSSD